MNQTTEMKQISDKRHEIKATFALEDLYMLLKNWRSWIQWGLKLLLAVGVGGAIYLCLWLIDLTIFAAYAGVLLGFMAFVYKVLRHDYLLMFAMDEYVQYDWSQITSQWREQKQAYEDLEERPESPEEKLKRLTSIAKLSNKIEKQAYVKKYSNS